MRKYRNQILLGLGLAFFIYVIFILVVDNSGQLEEGVGEHLRRFPWTLLIVMAGTQIAAGAFRFVTWNYYLGVIGARDKITLLDSAVIFVTGFTFVVSPGKAAELLKAVLLKLKTDVPIVRSAPIVLAERIVDGLAVIVITSVVLLIAPDELQLGDYKTISQAIIFTSAILIIAGLIVVQIRPLAYFFLNTVLARLPLIKRLQQPLVEFYESSREIFSLRHILPTMLFGLGVYLSTSAGMVVALNGFGLPIDGQLILQSMFMVGVVSAIGALSFVPNGAGISELSNAAMIVAIITPQHPEITPAVAAAAALIQGFFHKWFRVIVGMAVAVIFRQRLFPPELETALAEAEAERHHTGQTSYSVEGHQA
ncbi:MAG: lysylphosphatidylglycerol synthase transmembrane domain-containing protein [bacterium]|nr:lysylphosphatidylglycerol synthase transmembrane domain-containing protein [bacterium]